MNFLGNHNDDGVTETTMTTSTRNDEDLGVVAARSLVHDDVGDHDDHDDDHDEDLSVVAARSLADPL